jgi:hypothetical protein
MLMDDALRARKRAFESNRGSNKASPDRERFRIKSEDPQSSLQRRASYPDIAPKLIHGARPTAVGDRVVHDPRYAVVHTRCGDPGTLAKARGKNCARGMMHNRCAQR